MLSKCFEQIGAEHHIAVLASLAALDVNHHALAVDIADLEMSQLRASKPRGVERHQDGSVNQRRRAFDEAVHLLGAQNDGQLRGLLRVGRFLGAPVPS